MRLFEALVPLNEATLDEIKAKFDPNWKNRSANLEELDAPRLISMNQYGEMRFYVPSSTKQGIYIPVIRIEDWRALVPTLPQDISCVDLMLQNSNIRCKCNCHDFKFGGFQYILTQMNSAISPENRPPNKTNPQQRGSVCKHLEKAIDDIPNRKQTIFQNINLFRKLTPA